MHPRRRFTLALRDGRALVMGERTLVMGVINVTPDSFSDGGRLFEPAAAIDAGVRMVEEGADLLDVGGESTRPGAARSRGAATSAAGHRGDGRPCECPDIR
jgi:dihydropteroate synthase